jgi:hypothetical protein
MIEIPDAVGRRLVALLRCAVHDGFAFVPGVLPQERANLAEDARGITAMLQIQLKEVPQKEKNS